MAISRKQAPLVTMAVKAARAADAQRLAAGLDHLAVEIPSLHAAFDADACELVIGGQSELQLDQAFIRLRRVCGIALVEPIMKVEVTTPEDYTGFVMGDLLARRGQVQGQDMRGNAVVIDAKVPLANMFGYVNQLRSGTQGRGTYTMAFGHYEAVGPTEQPDPPFRPAAAMRAA